MVETGILPMVEPETVLTLEAPGGLIEARASCRDGRVERITVRNHTSFADRLDAELDVPGIGKVRVDTAYGGDSYVIVNAADFGFSLVPDEARRVAETGVRIVAAANAQLGFSHPENPDWTHFSFCQFTNPVEVREGVKTGRNTVVIQPGKLDRSPCGTGCSARMAVLHAKGKLTEGEPYTGISILGSEFHCRIAATAEIGGRAAIVPEISGRAWLTGQRTEWLDPDDPFPAGYRLSDTWPRLG